METAVGSLKRKATRVLLLAIGLGVSSLAIGCQGQPPVTPEPSPTDEIVYEVITNTPQPTIQVTEPSEPTITPIATFTPIPGLGPVPIKTATKTATRPPSPIQPTRLRASPTAVVVNSPTPAPPTAIPLKYGAPAAYSPTWGDSHHDGEDLTFVYLPSALLNPNECYLLHVGMVNPKAGPQEYGDDFLDTAHCGDQMSQRLNLTIFRPTHPNGYNYGVIETIAKQAADTPLLYVRWYVYIVQNNGPVGDGVHYNTVPLSPNSAPVQFDFLP